MQKQNKNIIINFQDFVRKKTKSRTDIKKITQPAYKRNCTVFLGFQEKKTNK